jgi:hypothetical protein
MDNVPIFEKPLHGLKSLKFVVKRDLFFNEPDNAGDPGFGQFIFL